MKIRAILFGLFVSFGAGAAAAGEITAEALERLPEAQVVILGEVHDNPVHHLHQARAVAALAPRALVWEMLSAEQASRLPADPAALADTDALAALLGWTESGWPDFALYHPIFLAAPGAQHFGAGVDRATARRVFDEELADVFGQEAPAFGLDQPLDATTQAAREAEQASAHCDALPEALLPGMVAAQRLRDGALAQAVVQALSQSGGPVVVITGNGHARRDWGVPLKLARVLPDVPVLALGQLEQAPAGTVPPYDLWIVTDSPPRPDPCAAFR